MKKQYKYRAVRFYQTGDKSEGSALVLTAAPSLEIEQWSGIPQKEKKEDTGETIGFQRSEDEKRLVDLQSFVQNPKNIIQNPLLCMMQGLQECKVEFKADEHAEDNEIESGFLSIEMPDFDEMTYLDLFERFRDVIQERIKSGDESGQESNQEQMEEKERTEENRFRERLAELGIDGSQKHQTITEDDTEDEGNDDEREEPTGVASLFEDSHIYDNLAKMRAICNILEDIGSSKQIEQREDCLGYTKESLIAYLRPIVVVDGQHRLRGAIKATSAAVNESKQAQIRREKLEDEGKGAEEIDRILLRENGRALPISLLMTSDASEKVFQFVVTNQKATPIPKALLSTIISTTLTAEELSRVTDRLKNAGIEVEMSEIVSDMAKSSDSPFRGLIDIGLDQKSNQLLKWSVIAGLIIIFRELRKGKLWGMKNDFADLWRKNCLESSPIVSNYAKKGFSDAHEYWSSKRGPWRDVFIVFWREVRKYFGDDNAESWNYWGNPRKSNLFNKVSLTILAADFFCYMDGKEIEISNAESVEKHVSDWLGGVSKNYFNRDWNLASVKRDLTGIRNQWAWTWYQYRTATKKNNIQKMPSTSDYRILKNG